MTVISSKENTYTFKFLNFMCNIQSNDYMSILIKNSTNVIIATAIILLFVITGVIPYGHHQQNHLRFTAEAGEGGPCIGYETAENTIAINCNASFLDVVQTINNPQILENGGNGEYILNANLEVADGITFAMTSNGNGLQYLKITGANGIIVHGRIEISGITITSWDTETDSPVSQTNTGSVPRAFINLRGSEGSLIQDSEIAYLGYNEPARRGFDLIGDGPSHDVEIRDSKFHDMWMAFYSNGAYNITVDGNEYYNNILYAIDPHTGTHNMTVSNNKVYNNNGIAVICSLDCYDIIFERNEVHDNVAAGLMFSRATRDSTIRDNIIYNQYESAYPISISESQNNEIYGNNISNSTFGISVHNPMELDADGMSSNNRIYNNTFDSVQHAIRARASSDNTFSNNVFGSVTDSHYIMAEDAIIHIENQIFDMVDVRGGSGDNTFSIRDSGTIIIDNSIHHDTDLEPYVEVLSSQSMNIDSARQ
jgi:parallel beta-helix repeat protein